MGTVFSLTALCWPGFIFLFSHNQINDQYAFASSVFADEQSKFLCDPGEIGIRNLCFSEFSPLLLHRFWSLQIIGTSMLTVEFNC